VAGPVSNQPARLDLRLLAIDADAFNHGGTPEFAAISTVVRRHNDISNTLSTARISSSRSISASRTARSMHVPGAWDSTPPCSRDYRLGATARHPATSTTAAAVHPAHCVDDPGIR